MKRFLTVLFAAMLVGQVWALGGPQKMASMMSKVRYEVSPMVLQANGNVEMEWSVTFPPKFFYSTAEVEITPILKYNNKEKPFNYILGVQGERVQGFGNVCSFANGGIFHTKSSIRLDEEEMLNSELYMRPKIISDNKEIVCPDIKVDATIIAPTASYTSVKYGTGDIELHDGNLEMEFDITFPKDFFRDETATMEITPVLKYDDEYRSKEKSLGHYTVQGKQVNGSISDTFGAKLSVRFEEGMRNSELYVRAKIITGDIEIVCPEVKAADIAISSSDPTNYEIDQISESGMIFVGRCGYISARIHKNNDKELLLLMSLHDDIKWPLDGKYLVVSGEDYASFEKNMAIVNEKYAKWTQTAKTDGVKNFRKTIVDFGDKIGRMSLFNMRGTTKLYAVFEVDENGKCLLKFGSQEIDDSEYAYSNYAPYYTFYSPENFREFYEIIKYDNAMKNYKIMKSKLDAKKKSIEDRNAKFD
ncbi:MAG: hypothetical protein IKP62_10775 [Salinivirgaceae bacterium]|nr:hypothetical protein [Salinivirgaceae bacterium]